MTVLTGSEITVALDAIQAGASVAEAIQKAKAAAVLADEAAAELSAHSELTTFPRCDGARASEEDPRPAGGASEEARFDSWPGDHEAMAASVLLADCPDCGADLHGTIYAHCPSCGWSEFEALGGAANDHHEQGAIA